jgi:hypothetical protein
VVHAGSRLQTVYIRSVKRKGKTTTRSRGTRRKESARVDTDPLPKGLAGSELGFSRTSTASVLRNDACLRLPARNTLNIALFRLLKRAYGKQVEKMMRTSLTRVFKENLFPVFKNAFFAILANKTFN